MHLKSCIYESEIWHTRISPRMHKFKHKHFMLYLFLEELEQVENLRLFSSRSSALYSFKESDHIPEQIRTSDSLADRVRSALLERGVKENIHSISLLTNVRVAGYVFNPASFFFCFDERAKLLCCLVEVGNTFGEKKLYVVRPDQKGRLLDRQKKLFYVSPFTQLDQDFLFKINLPEDKLQISIDTMSGDSAVVVAGISGKRVELSDRTLLKEALRYPLAPLAVITLIHLHALLLWLKKVPHHKKEASIEQQVSVLHPHKSLLTGTQGNP